MEGVAGDQRVVAQVEKGQMPRRVSWRGYRFQRPNPVARRQRAGRLGFASLVRTAQLALHLAGIQAALATQEACVAGADQHLGSRQRGVQRIQRRDVIHVRVRQHDPADRRAMRLGRR